jgi:hypothetical protein
MMKKSCIAVSALVLSLLPGRSLVATELKEMKRGMVLYGEGKAHPAHELTDQGSGAAFRSSGSCDVRLYPEYLDDSRFGVAGHTRTVADYLRRKYAAVTDLIPAVEEVLRGGTYVSPSIENKI